jgi:aspartyl-tRNA(Asn)/glutamyl-tRNA(Gln) amidotransferase subunit A
LDTIQAISNRLRTGSVSPVELTSQCLDRIQALNPALNAFITVTADSAMQQARESEAELREGKWRGPLHGIPIGLKDLIDTADVRTTAASALYQDRIPNADAEVVRRLKAAGAVLLGKQNLHEFAYGGSSLVSHFGEMHNPWNLDHITGGSSGGSAAAVAAGLGYAAIGTDTAGSVREPAAFCGVVGLKPTYGRVSVRGIIPLALSFDHVGPITRCVADAALLLEVLAGHDPDDPYSIAAPASDFTQALRLNPKKLRVGIPRSYFFEALQPEVASATSQALTVIASLVASVDDIKVAVNTDRTLQSAESYNMHAANIAASPELYQPETLKRLQAGAATRSEQLAPLREELAKIRREIGKVFSHCDLLVTPTMPVPAPTIRELKENPAHLRPAELEMLRNTRPVNVWGLPAISIPCGFTAQGLPVGVQLIGPPWREDLVLGLAFAYEQATAWHKRVPAICTELEK